MNFSKWLVDDMPKKADYSCSSSAILSLAQKSRDEFGMEGIRGYNVGWKIREILKKRYGFHFRTGEGSPSLLIYDRDDVDVILLPYTSNLRDNFSIMHEFGHYLMHCDFDSDGREPISFCRYRDDLRDIQSNYFAYSFLVQEKELEDIMKEYDNHIYSVAGHFDVHVDVIKQKGIL